MKAFLLSAGLGTRLQPLTNHIPKPCLPFLNIPLGLYSKYLLQLAGCRDFIVNTHHLPEQVKKLFEQNCAQNETLQFFNESPKILGSGGAVFNAQSAFKNSKNFWLINADEVFFPENLKVLNLAWDQHLTQKNDGTILVMEHPEVTKKFGAVWCDSSMRVYGFGKTSPNPSLTLKPWHFIGYQILNEGLLPLFPAGESNVFYDVFTKNINAKKFAAFEVKGLWYETGHFQDYVDCHKLLLDSYEHLRKSNAFFASLTDHFHSQMAYTKTSTYTSLTPKTLTLSKSPTGFVCIDQKAQIPSTTQISNVIIYSSAVITASSIQNQIIGPDFCYPI